MISSSSFAADFGAYFAGSPLFGSAEEFRTDMEEITGEKGIFTIQEAEPIGPSGYLDALVIAPCTGNTLANLYSRFYKGPIKTG